MQMKMKIQQKYIITMIVAIASATASYAINYYLNLGPINNYQRAGPVFAASLIGIIAALFLKSYAVTAYIGAFVGMSSLQVIPSIWYAPIFGLVCGIVCIIFASQFVGFGGKAGTTAFLSVNVTAYLFIVGSALGLSTFKLEDYFKNLTSIDSAFLAAAILSGVFGIMATMLLREKVLQKTIKTNEAVLAPAIVGLLSAIVVPWIPPTDISVKLPTIIASGTYAGMASRNILPKTEHWLATGIIVGILNVTTATIFIGFGGGLGFRGLLSIVILRIMMSFFK
jgi:hypothetical protein